MYWYMFSQCLSTSHKTKKSRILYILQYKLSSKYGWCSSFQHTVSNIPHRLPFSLPLLFPNHKFNPTHSDSYDFHPKQQSLFLLQPFSQRKLRWGWNKRKSLVRTGGVLTSSSFPWAMIEIIVLAITDSNTYAWKIGVLPAAASDKDTCYPLANHPLHPLPCSLPITISFILCKHYQKTSHTSV